MKKVFIILFAFVCALIATELFVTYVIGYPKYGVTEAVHYRQGKEYWMNMWKPYSSYWTVEGGNKVFRRNNLGLPGTDINAESETKIAVLGSSFIEAYQVRPEMMATSVFNKLLTNSRIDAAVYNLGCSGHDPYDMWFRIKYFESKESFDTVIMILETDFSFKMKSYKEPLSYKPDARFASINNSLKLRLANALRNYSSFVALVLYGRTIAKLETDSPETRKTISFTRILELTPQLSDCLINFRNKYGKRFTLVTITEVPEFNRKLESFCSAKGINYYNKPMFRQELLIKGAGHLNERGNRELGKVLYNAYLKYRGK
jgi:hypothetical protein